MKENINSIFSYLLLKNKYFMEPIKYDEYKKNSYDKRRKN